MIKYRVYYLESEAGLVSDTWTTDYDTEEAAPIDYQQMLDKFVEKFHTPSYYIKPTYIGAVEV